MTQHDTIDRTVTVGEFCARMGWSRSHFQRHKNLLHRYGEKVWLQSSIASLQAHSLKPKTRSAAPAAAGAAPGQFWQNQPEAVRALRAELKETQ